MNDVSPAAPFVVHEDEVVPEWIDYNGHMNVAYYVLVFDRGTDALFDRLDVGAAYRARTGASLFAVETHVGYRAEVKLGDRLRIESQLLGVDAKRVHFFSRMFHARENYLAATYEALGLNVDLARRRAAPFDPVTHARLAAAVAAQAALGRPAEAGRAIAALSG